MRIHQVHNAYLRPGGEDVVLDLEADLLRSRGHEVTRFSASNQELDASRPAAAARAAIETVWSRPSARRFAAEASLRRPDVVHVHNTFARISPAIFWECRRMGLPVVLTLHNYRLLCANALLLREGRPCEDCVGRFPWPALVHRCYRGSRSGTGVLVAMQSAHRLLGTWRHRVDAFIALTEFARALYVRGGVPEDRLFVKPNFVPDPLPGGSPGPDRRRCVVYVGRVAEEKGADVLLEAWSALKPRGWTLLVIGDGPARAALQARFADLEGVVWRGWLDRGPALEELARCRFVTLPSRYYEGFPLVLVEAMALGVPAIVPDFGAFPGIVVRGETAGLFTPGRADSLCDALREAMALPEEAWSRWSRAARRRYLERYSPEVNYQALMRIYTHAAERRRKGER